jgi:hypothetical protein
VEELVAQRVYGLALGYEDLNDHEELRNDPLLAVLVEKADPGNQTLAGKSTLNRLELTKETASRKERYKKIVLDHGAVDRLLVQVFLQAHQEAPKEIILDLDATDDPLHGQQEGRFFHGYYGHYCYLPLYIFCGEFLLCARLRSSNIDASEGSVGELQRIVEQIRCAWPEVRIVVRGDSGFCREELMAWCEANRVEYLLGLAKNERLTAEIAQEMGEDATKRVVFAFAPNLKTTNAFLRFVMEEFEVKTDKNYARSLKNFEQFLIDQFKAGISPVLLIDEAQNMTLDMLRLVHHMFNFATDTDFLIQMALFGQNELKDKIERYSSLKSRMTPARLEPFTLDESQQMIDYRCRTAGGRSPSAASSGLGVSMRASSRSAASRWAGASRRR